LFSSVTTLGSYDIEIKGEELEEILGGAVEEDTLTILKLKGEREKKEKFGDASVARSRQVYMKWWWKHCLLLSILPG
jgi:hypothetical protein